LGEEADAARLAPWLAVAFGIGILLYFAAPSEPSPYAPAVKLALFGGIVWVSREREIDDVPVPDLPETDDAEDDDQ
jgi:competence protein ComEC